MEILNFFDTLTLKQIFWKTKTLFKKRNIYKIALSELPSKANRMGSTKWAYHKECSFASSYFIFLKILFKYKNLNKELI